MSGSTAAKRTRTMGADSAWGTSLGTDGPAGPTTKAPLRIGAGPVAWSSRSGALGGTRTPNLLIRSQMLSPIELRARVVEMRAYPPLPVAAQPLMLSESQ